MACDIISDSKSVISCLERDKLSDRRHARIPCRGWLARAKAHLLRRPRASLKHVHSHTGKDDILSVGNAAADLLAKEARSLGPVSPDVFTMDTCGVYLTFKTKVLMGGVKDDVSRVISEIRRSKWKALPSQGATMSQFRSSFRAIQKQVRDLAVQGPHEKVWSSFILNSLRWSCAPRKHKIRQKCSLCLMQADDEMKHLGTCPVFRPFHTQINQVIMRNLAPFSVPFVEVEPPEVWSVRHLLSSPAVEASRRSWGLSSRHLSSCETVR